MDQKNEIFYYNWKEVLKISRTAKFNDEMLYNTENIALRSFQILYIFVLSARKVISLLD